MTGMHLINEFAVVLIIAAAFALGNSDRVGTMSLVREVNRKTKLWTASLSSPVAHLTRDEARALLGAGPEGFERPSPLIMKEKVHTAEEIVNAPESYDPRDYYPDCSSLNLVRDQSACGSCWAVSSASVMSDRTCIGKKEDVILSSYDTLACSGGGGCGGGNPYRAFQYWNETGVVTDDCRAYPFPSCDHHVPGSKNPCPDEDYPSPNCSEKCDNGKNWNDDKHFASEIYSVSGHDNIVAELAMNGPCEATFAVFDDFMVYTSGIYHHVSGDVIGFHSVRIIGYGVENDTKYWLIANSWNEHWGEKGFFRMLRGSNECTIESDAHAGIAK